MNRFPQRRQPLPPHCFCYGFLPAKRSVVGCLLVGLAVATGCQQPNGQMNLPTNPMVGSTRVPAPPTGSVGATTGYAPATYAQTGIAAQPTVGLPASNLVPQFAPPAATHYAAAPQYAPSTPLVSAAPFTPSAPLSPSPAAALQQAGYAETSAHGGSVAPTVSLAPQLRGMAVNDLTPAGQAPYLQAQAQLQAQPQLQTAVSLQPQTSSAGTWTSQGTGLTPLPAPPAALAPVPTAPATAAPASTAGGQDSWNVVGSGVAAPSTSPVVREASNSSADSSQNLPWRAPTTAR